ncbi:MAG: LysR family transcriptional regulator, partial [Betaproteobacteria bacterium]|nr:LysR family transcriptional regulator [Betaproteobacteria bacterium]
MSDKRSEQKIQQGLESIEGPIMFGGEESMLPDLDSLSLFVRAAELGNLTRAAESSFITVPAASRRLSLLEHQFKTQLFERHSRGLQLTAAGERLLALAREVIAQVHYLRSEMSNYGQGKQRVLRIQGNTSAMAQFLPRDIALFQAKYNDIRIVFEESWSEDAVRKLRRHEADIAIVVEGCAVDGLWTRPYRRDLLAAVLSECDPLQGAAIAFEELLDRDLVGLEGGSTLTRLLTSQASAMMRPMPLRVQVRSFEAVCRAVEAGLGVGILPIAAAGGFCNAMRLKVIPLTDSWAMRRMLMCLRSQPDPDSDLGMLV